MYWGQVHLKKLEWSLRRGWECNRGSSSAGEAAAARWPFLASFPRLCPNYFPLKGCLVLTEAQSRGGLAARAGDGLREMANAAPLM